MLNESGSKLTAPDRSVEHTVTCLRRKGGGMIYRNTWRSGSSSHPHLLHQYLLNECMNGIRGITCSEMDL